MPYLILAQSDVTARALSAWLELLSEEPLKTGGDRLDDPRVLFSQSCAEFPGGLIPCFKRVSSNLSHALESVGAAGPVVLVDSIRPSDMSAVGAPSGWNRLVTLLVLAFPEVRWVFGLSSGFAEDSQYKDWQARHGLPSLFHPEFDPLFDGTGLRAHITRTTLATMSIGKLAVAPWIPQRTKWAAAIDDERMYAYLHAYVAYRHGYRAFSIHSQALGDHLLRHKGDSEEKWPHLTIEDYFLGFPDRSTTGSLAQLEERDAHWKALKKSEHRCFVTSGHKRGRANEVASKNRAYRDELRATGHGGLEATKPVPGIFGLWKDLRLDRKYLGSDRDGRRGLAPGFIWPWSTDRGDHPVDEDTGGHSAPGLLLLVAELLIDRAESLLDSVRSVSDAVRGAVLASSALELLGPKTPTTAREALELKHRFEVLAECQFGGIQYNLQLDERFYEIRRDIRQLGHWYGVRARDVAMLNGELTILSRLVPIFRDYEEFDEEEKCRRRIRTLHRRVWWKQYRRNPLNWIVWPIRAYIEFLLGSLTRLTGAIFLWILGLTVAFMLMAPQAKQAQAVNATESRLVASVRPAADPEIPTAWWAELEGTVTTVQDEPELKPFSQAVSHFFGIDALNSTHFGWVALSLLATLSGFVHLGIFISQLYSTVSRR